MSEQLPIDFTARARSTDRASAHDAATKVDGRGLARKVLEELRVGGPGTSHDLADRMGLSLVTVSPRMRPLERAGLIREDGRRDGRTLWVAV